MTKGEIMATKMSPKCTMKESAHKCARRDAIERDEKQAIISPCKRRNIFSGGGYPPVIRRKNARGVGSGEMLINHKRQLFF